MSDVSSKADEAVMLLKQFQAAEPLVSAALSALPVSGQVMAAIQYYGAMQRGDTADGIAAAVQFGLGPLGAKAGSLLKKAGEEAMTVARAGITSGDNLVIAGGDMARAADIYSAAKSAGQTLINKGRAWDGAAKVGQALPDAVGAYKGYFNK